MTETTTAPKQNPLPARRPSLAELNAAAVAKAAKAAKDAARRMASTGVWMPA